MDTNLNLLSGHLIKRCDFSNGKGHFFKWQAHSCNLCASSGGIRFYLETRPSHFCSKTLDLHKNWHSLPIWVREGHKKGDPIFFWTCAQYLRLSALNRIFRLDFLQIWTILGKNQGQLIMSINPNGTASCWDLWFYPLGKKFESWNFLESNLQVSHILTNVRGWI